MQYIAMFFRLCTGIDYCSLHVFCMVSHKLNIDLWQSNNWHGICSSGVFNQSVAMQWFWPECQSPIIVSFVFA